MVDLSHVSQLVGEQGVEQVQKLDVVHQVQAYSSTNGDVYPPEESLLHSSFAPKLYDNKEYHMSVELSKYRLEMVVHWLRVWLVLARSFQEQNCEYTVEQQQKEGCLYSVSAVISVRRQSK